MDASTAVLSGPITLNPIKMAWEYEEQESGASQSLTTRPYERAMEIDVPNGNTKQAVFGVFERGGRVFTEIVPDTKKATLQRLIRDRVALDAVVVSDGWRAYDGLVDVGYDRHLRIKKARPTAFSKNGVHINGIESFWSFTKRRLVKFNGVPASTFELHLKECEWRWSKSPDKLFAELKTLLV